MTRSQSVLETKWGLLILPNGSRSKIQNKHRRRSRDSMTSSLTWQVYGPGVEAHNYGYSRRTLARSVSIDSLDLPRAIGVWITICWAGKQKLRQAKEGHPPVRKRAYFRWLVLGRALELCGTGKHPNINVETQIPLELGTKGKSEYKHRLDSRDTGYMIGNDWEFEYDCDWSTCRVHFVV